MKTRQWTRDDTQHKNTWGSLTHTGKDSRPRHQEKPYRERARATKPQRVTQTTQTAARTESLPIEQQGAQPRELLPETTHQPPPLEAEDNPRHGTNTATAQHRPEAAHTSQQIVEARHNIDRARTWGIPWLYELLQQDLQALQTGKPRPEPRLDQAMTAGIAARDDPLLVTKLAIMVRTPAIATILHAIGETADKMMGGNPYTTGPGPQPGDTPQHHAQE